MTEIIIIGDPHDRALEMLIRDILAKTYRIVYIRENMLNESGAGYELVCFDCRSPELIGLSAPVIVAKRSAVIPARLPANSTVIVNADNSEQIEAVRKSGAFAVECGFSPTSTVSFTSESEDKLVISLNRSVTALSGRQIQPLEIPVSKHGADDYTLMSFTALRVLLDDFNSELGALI
ncbi:MAG TPA: hypothetical protein DDX72_05675 [Ruminococcaceae bacterium]|nr:hypothetical protein [Oscillospiraceae bacterium]